MYYYWAAWQEVAADMLPRPVSEPADTESRADVRDPQTPA